MTGRWEAWLRLLPVWLPAVLLSVASIALYWWQTSDTTGAGARLRNQVNELDQGIENLQAIRSQAIAQQEQVRALSEELKALSKKSFGSLEGRLTSVMREVETATRQAGMLPASFGYSTNLDNDLPFTQFGITFNVKGQYSQVRQMLATLHQSPELLMVERLSLAGESDASSRQLRVSISLITYLGQTDQAQVDRLTQELMRSLDRPEKAKAQAEEATVEEPAAQAATAGEPAQDPAEQQLQELMRDRDEGGSDGE